MYCAVPQLRPAPQHAPALRVRAAIGFHAFHSEQPAMQHYAFSVVLVERFGANRADALTAFLERFHQRRFERRFGAEVVFQRLGGNGAHHRLAVYASRETNQQVSAVEGRFVVRKTDLHKGVLIGWPRQDRVHEEPFMSPASCCAILRWCWMVGNACAAAAFSCASVPLWLSC